MEVVSVDSSVRPLDYEVEEVAGGLKFGEGSCDESMCMD